MFNIIIIIEMGEHIITRTTMVINLRITHVVVVRTDHVVTIVAVVVPIADQDNHKPLFIILASNNFRSVIRPSEQLLNPPSEELIS